MSGLRSMLARLARLEEWHGQDLPPPRILDVIVDPDGVVREVIDADGSALPAAELAAMGYPCRVAPGWPRGEA